MVIVRSGVGVNYREPPDEIGRVGISVISRRTFCKQKQGENTPAGTYFVWKSVGVSAAEVAGVLAGAA